MNKFKFELGETLQCKVTEFTGIATAKVEYLNGCIQYCLVPKIGADNKRPNGEYIDQGQLSKINNGISVEQSDTGGPQRDCPKH